MARSKVKSIRHPASSAMRYRGWTLVDRGRMRFANKDGTDVYRLVCRENEQAATARSMFMKVVDREEDGDS